MSEVPPVLMIREEDEDAMDPDSRTDNDGKRQHDAEFYRDDKVQRAYCIGFRCIRSTNFLPSFYKYRTSEATRKRTDMKLLRCHKKAPVVHQTSCQWMWISKYEICKSARLASGVIACEQHHKYIHLLHIYDVVGSDYLSACC